MEQKHLDELKRVLLEEKEKLESSLNKIARPVDTEDGDYETSFDALGTDKDDNATEVDQYTQNLSVETSLEKQLQEILEALARMEKGTYGKCENCSKDISLERLKANPSARICLGC